MPLSGTRYQYDPVSLDTIDFIWPDESVTAAPTASDSRRWAMKDDHTICCCPTPDKVYQVELTGLFPLSYINSSNPTSNYLTINYPELFLAAGMVWLVGGFQRDVGANAESPGYAEYWEQQYQRLLASAIDEENRRRGLLSPGAAQSRGAQIAKA